ncbi:hypothetical protein KI387_016435, partial [Taxus chinensis]
TTQGWRDLIHRVCADTLLLPSGNTRAELTKDIKEPSVAGRHTDVFAPVWKVEKLVSSLHTELVGYRTTECLMRLSHSH